MAEQAIFPAFARERAGKGAARAVRREGLVPGVIYGASKEPQMISVDPRVIMKQLEQGVLYSTVYAIEIEGAKNEKALPREVQFHPVSDAPIHIDFMRLKKGSTINVMIPVNFTNEEECEGIKLGGVFSITREEVELLCPADDIPSEVECDLTKFEIGDTIRISDVALPEGVEPVINDRDFVVANISAPKTASAEVEDEADDAEEAVEAEEASEE